MRKNIECNEEHKKISVPANIRTKLRMLATIAGVATVGVLSVATFSGCSAEKKEIQSFPDVPTTSYVEQINEEQVESRQEIEYEFEDTQENIEEPEEYEDYEEYEEDVVEEQQDEYEEEEEYQEEENEYNQNYNDSEYNELSNRLQGIIEEKGFTNNEINMLLKETLDKLYSNYSSWQQGYDDMPNVVDYINENFLDVLENKVYEIEFVDENSSRGQQLLNDGMPAGATRVEHGKYCIRMIVPKNIDSNEDTRSYSIEELLHEIIHCKQGEITFNSDYFDGHDSVIDIYTEGAATFHEKFTNEYTTDVLGSWSIANNSGTKTIDYTKENGIGYLVELNAYEKLVYLLGYNFMNKIDNGEIPFSKVEIEMGKIYRETGKTFLNQMTQWYTNYQEKGWQDDKTYNSAVKFENSFLEIAKKDKNKEKFNHYLEKNLPTVSDASGKDITDQVFNTGRSNDYER